MYSYTPTHLERGDEGLVGDLDFAEPAHLLAGLLHFEKLAAQRPSHASPAAPLSSR